LKLRIVLVTALFASTARADLPACASEADVLLTSEPEAVPLDEVYAQLAAGLSGSGIRVCGTTTGEPLARVTLIGDPRDETPTIRVSDRVTHKQLERSLELAQIPADGRPVAIALYIEELLQVSWAELALKTEAAAQREPISAPQEVKREVAKALPPPKRQVIVRPPRAPRPPLGVRLAVGATISRFHGGLTQAGPTLSLGLSVRRWLEASLRLGYRLAPRSYAQSGSVDTQSMVAGAFLTPRVSLGTRLSLLFPQGFDVSSTTFLAHANADAVAGSAVRVAVVILHGAGLEVRLTRSLSLCAIGRLSWTALPAEAAEDGRAVVGISGIGGEGELTLNARF
jgi:hypothetical protein